MVNKELECFAPKDRQMVAVELGSSYGNTTLSYKCGHNWDAAVDFWLKEDLQYGVAITKKRSPSFEFRNPQDPTHPSFAYFLTCKN